MNKDKISSQEIIDLLASKASISKRAAEEFLKVMIFSIEEALLAGEVVKIKNFGTFKLQWNEPRKSVNVQTGEEILLSGYHKVSFIPDTILKDLVNEPFAHLEPVKLDVEDIEPVQEGTDVPLDPLRIFTEQASEIRSILDEIQALSSKTEFPPIEETEPKEHEAIAVDELLDEELPEQIQPEEKVEIKNEIEEPEEQKHEEPKEIIDIIQPAQPTETVLIEDSIPAEQIDNQLVVESDEEQPDETLNLDEPKPDGRKAWLWVLVILVFLGGTGSGLYYFYPPAKEFFTKSKDSIYKMTEKMSITEMLNTVTNWFSPASNKAPAPVTVVIPKDTTAIDTIGEKDEVDSLQSLFDNPRVYTEFVGSERIKSGSRLTLMSKRYYGNKNFWVYIYEANRDHISDPDNIPIGTLIRFPKLDPRLIDSTNPRCIQKAKELHDIYVK